MQENRETLEYLYSSRNLYIQNQYDQCKELDRNMFLISSGVFSLSITFINTIIPHPVKTCVPLLIISWGIILSSIITSLIAYILNYYAYKEAIRIIDYRITNNNNEPERENLYTPILEVINVVTLALLAIGLVILVVFVADNMRVR
jgi:hypothetical protein